VSFSNSAWNCCRPKEWLEAFHSVFHRNRPSNLPRGAFHNMLGSGETSAFSELYPKVIPSGLEGPDSNGSWAPQEPYWQKKNGAQQSEDAMNGYSQDAEWERQEPHDGIEHQSQER
jgi:hypothetical protein